MSAAAPMAVVVGLVLLLGWVSAPLATGSLPVGRSLGLVRRVEVVASWRPERRRRDGAGEVEEVARLRTALGSGASLLAAFAVVARAGGPWAPAAERVVRRSAAGVALGVALEEWRAASDGRALVADALAIAGATGGSQAAALEAVGRTLVERRSLEREIRALASQAVASAMVVVVAPLGFAVLIAAVDPRVRAAYGSSLVVPACAVVGLALDAVGAWWMATLIRRVR